MGHVKGLLGHGDFRSLDAYVRLEIPDLKDMHRRFHPREREDEPGRERLDKADHEQDDLN